MTNQITPRPINSRHQARQPATPARRRAGLAAALVGLVLVVTGCTGGPGDRNDFVEVLTRDESFSANEAGCIADAVFDRYGEDGDALQKISAAESYEFLTGEDGVDGFGEYFDSTVADCTAIGPSADE